jgi:hypothetical protein
MHLKITKYLQSKSKFFNIFKYFSYVCFHVDPLIIKAFKKIQSKKVPFTIFPDNLEK